MMYLLQHHMFTTCSEGVALRQWCKHECELSWVTSRLKSGRPFRAMKESKSTSLPLSINTPATTGSSVAEHSFHSLKNCSHPSGGAGMLPPRPSAHIGHIILGRFAFVLCAPKTCFMCLSVMWAANMAFRVKLGDSPQLVSVNYWPNLVSLNQSDTSMIWTLIYIGRISVLWYTRFRSG